MIHLTEAKLLEYVKDELPEVERTVVESHLYMCDECLTTYMNALQKEKSQLPSLQIDDHSFTDQIMEKITREYKVEKNEAEIHGKTEHVLKRRTLFHYVVACAMTILFLNVGVFDMFANYVKDVHAATVSADKPSISEQIIDMIYSGSNEQKED